MNIIVLRLFKYFRAALSGLRGIRIIFNITQIYNLSIPRRLDRTSWILGKNYSLVVNQVDVDGKKVWFSLCKNGREIESGIVNTNGILEDKTFTATAYIESGSGQLYFLCGYSHNFLIISL